MPKVTGVERVKAIRGGNPKAIGMLFTGFAAFDPMIAAINHGQIFKFLKKPWQRQAREEAVREAGAEYDRLVEHAEMMEKMRFEVQQLRERITALEKEVERLRKT